MSVISSSNKGGTSVDSSDWLRKKKQQILQASYTPKQYKQIENKSFGSDTVSNLLWTSCKNACGRRSGPSCTINITTNNNFVYNSNDNRYELLNDEYTLECALIIPENITFFIKTGQIITGVDYRGVIYNNGTIYNNGQINLTYGSFYNEHTGIINNTNIIDTLSQGGGGEGGGTDYDNNLIRCYFSNRGTITNSGIINIRGAVFETFVNLNNDSGQITGDGSFYLSTSEFINNGIINAQIYIKKSYTFINNATITDLTIEKSGTFINNGTFEGSFSILTQDGTFTNNNMFKTNGNEIINNGTLENKSGGSIINNNGVDIDNNITYGYIENNGTITNFIGGTITNNGAICNGPDGVFNNDGTFIGNPVGNCSI